MPLDGIRPKPANQSSWIHALAIVWGLPTHRCLTVSPGQVCIGSLTSDPQLNQSSRLGHSSDHDIIRECEVSKPIELSASFDRQRRTATPNGDAEPAISRECRVGLRDGAIRLERNDCTGLLRIEHRLTAIQFVLRFLTLCFAFCSVSCAFMSR